MARLFGESGAVCRQPAVVPPEILRLEEQEHPSARLAADRGLLLRRGGLAEHEARSRRAGGPDPDPALAAPHGNILQHAEAQRLGEEGDGPVVVVHDQHDVGDSLLHWLSGCGADGQHSPPNQDPEACITSRLLR